MESVTATLWPDDRAGEGLGHPGYQDVGIGYRAVEVQALIGKGLWRAHVARVVLPVIGRPGRAGPEELVGVLAGRPGER